MQRYQYESQPSPDFADDVPELSDEYFGQESRMTKKQPSLRYSRNRILPTRKKASSILPESYSSNSSRSKETSNRSFAVMKVIIAIALTFGCFSSSTKFRSIKKDTLEFKIEMENIHNAIQDTQNDLDRLHEDLENLHADTIGDEEASTEVFYGIEHRDHREAASNDIMNKHDLQYDKILELQKHVQKLHLKELLKRFGPGPYYVEFEVSIQGKTHYFTLKTAPNNSMPHSIYVFMDMVDKKVWNKTVIIHMWNHIVQAAPITPEGENLRNSVGGELMFPENSDFFNHEEYTVGFSGRPGGPEFYINILDNAQSHGPGRQDHSTILNDADPCFAKVVAGYRTVDLLRELSHELIKDKNENGGEGLAFSSIEKAKIVLPQTLLAARNE